MKSATKEVQRVVHPSGKVLSKQGPYAVLFGDQKLRTLPSVMSPYFPFNADEVSVKLAASKARKAEKDPNLGTPKNATEIQLEWKQYGLLSFNTSDLVKATFTRAKNAESRVDGKQLSRKDFLEIVVEPCIQKILKTSKAPHVLSEVYFKELSKTLADFYECYDTLEHGAMVADLDHMVFGTIPLVAKNRETGRPLLCEWKTTSSAHTVMKFGKFDDPAGPEHTVVQGKEDGAIPVDGNNLPLMNEKALKERRLGHLINGKGQQNGLKMALLGHIALRNEYTFGAKAAENVKSTANFGRRELDKTIADKFDLGVVTVGRDPEGSIVAQKVPCTLDKDMVGNGRLQRQLQMIDQGEHEGKAMLNLERPSLTLAQLRLIDPSWYLPPGNDLGVDSNAGFSRQSSGSSGAGERIFFDSLLME